jgi:hypothetical protein
MRTNYKMMVACVGTGSEERRDCDEGSMEETRESPLADGSQRQRSAANCIGGVDADW